MKITKFQSLLSEAIKPTTEQKRRYEIGALIIDGCGDGKVRDAYDLCKKARINIGIASLVSLPWMEDVWVFHPEGFTVSEIRESAGLPPYKSGE